MNYRLLKLIWKPGYVLIHRRTVVGVAAQRRRVVQHSGFLLVHINCAGAALTLICAADFKVYDLLTATIASISCSCLFFFHQSC